MREHAMHPPHRRRFVATTDSNHDEPVFPDRSRDSEVDGPNQLWVADLTYIAILGGFVYLAAIMDAWSRRIVGYAIGRRIDARLTLAALATAIEHRNPPPGCIHHSDSQGLAIRRPGLPGPAQRTIGSGPTSQPMPGDRYTRTAQGRLRASDGRILLVGTTAVRLVEWCSPRWGNISATDTEQTVPARVGPISPFHAILPNVIVRRSGHT